MLKLKQFKVWNNTMGKIELVYKLLGLTTLFDSFEKTQCSLCLTDYFMLK